MITGDALSARLAVRGFARLTSEISSLQDRISAGTNDPRPSADPARAAELSALRDLRARMDRQDSMAHAAAGRLALADEALRTVGESVQRVKEIALLAATATLPDEGAAALRTEIARLREDMLAQANAADASGRPLFAGTGEGPAFAIGEDGRVVYRGNAAATMAQLGDRVLVGTGVPGTLAFGDGASGAFALLDDLELALSETHARALTVASAEDAALLDLPPDAGGSLQATITGPAGSARVTLDLRPEGRSTAAAAVNAVSAQTGVTAVVEGGMLRLAAAGGIGLSASDGGTGRAGVLGLTPLRPDGSVAGATVRLRAGSLSPEALVAAADRAVSDAAEARAAAGLLAAAVERQQEALAAQGLVVDQAVSGLEDLDVAAAVTRLQSLLVTQEAAQQTYVRIAGQSLFDYLR
jgi:flagellar hook-associated protein 3 FlgL